MRLNEIKFGNPNRQHLIYLNTENYLDSLITELSSYPPPENESSVATNEINTLIDYTNHLAKDEVLKSRFELYDTDYENYIIEKLKNSGIPEKDVTDLVVELHKDIVPLLVKMKYLYNRIRPYQLAGLKEMSLYPFRARSADSPSYPSGHCFQSKVYAEVLGNRYPKYYKAFQELAVDIMWSRQYLGAHYPSDSEFATYMADIVVKHPDFRKKYKL
jgi:hypothetical protein